MVAGHTQLTHGIDVSGAPLEAGIRSLEAHEAYLAALPWHPAPREMLTGMTAGQGERLGVDSAVLVHVWDM